MTIISTRNLVCQLIAWQQRHLLLSIVSLRSAPLFLSHKLWQLSGSPIQAVKIDFDQQVYNTDSVCHRCPWTPFYTCRQWHCLLRTLHKPANQLLCYTPDECESHSNHVSSSTSFSALAVTKFTSSTTIAGSWRSSCSLVSAFVASPISSSSSMKSL